MALKLATERGITVSQKKRSGEENGDIPCSWTGRISSVKKFYSLKVDV